MAEKTKTIISPVFSLILFDILLVLTPFVMLQNYLQGVVHSLSHFHLMFWESMSHLLSCLL